MSSETRPDARKPTSIFTTIIVMMTLAMTVLFVGFAAFHLTVATKTQRQDHEQYVTTTLHFVRAELSTKLEEDESELEELEEIEDVVLRENASRRFGKLILEILDESGNVLLATSGAAEVMSESPPFPPKAASPGMSSITYWESAKGKQYVLSSLRTRAPDGRVRQVQLALDWSEAEDRVEAFRRQSVGAALVCTLLAAFAAAFVTRHALRPLSVIREATESIRRGSFDVRLRPEQLPTELSDLAESFARMQVHLKESFERLSQFSAELAHELRTPVNNLMGETEVALSKMRTVDEYRETLSSTLEEAARLSRMIDSLLFLAHASRGSPVVEAERLDIAHEVDNVIEYHRAQADELGVTLERKGDAEISADRTLFRRMLSNLLSNALEASSSGGSVVVSITQSPEGASISVIDDGGGIDRVDLPRVFERFHRSREARLLRPEGSGLGLAIVKSIVELHRGSVSIESAAGKGTTVTLEFPSHT